VWLVGAGDVNGDGRLDIVASTVGENNPGYTHAAVFDLVGRADGTLEWGHLQDVTGDGWNVYPLRPKAAVVDVNEDGNPDLALVGQFGGAIAVALVQPDGRLPDKPEVGFQMASPIYMTTADINADGRADVIVAIKYPFGDGAYGNAALRILPVSPTGGFLYAPDLSVGSFPDIVSVGVGDLNDDGHPDLAITWSDYLNFDRGGAVQLGNGDGTFGPPISFPAGLNPGMIAVGDLNGDGHGDLVVRDGSPSSLSVLLGNGDGTFRAPTGLPTGGPPGDFMMVHLNGDGPLDLVAMVGAAAWVFLGKGDGTFAPPSEIPAGGPVGEIAIGDVNRDGRLDAVMCLPTGVAVALGNGDGTFAAPVLTPGTVGASPVIADWNLDGKPDLALATNGVTLLLGHGDGTFGSKSTVGVGYAGAGPIVTADFNVDGRPDVAAINWDDSHLALLYGSGTSLVSAPSVEPDRVTAFGLGRAVPNPARGPLRVEFALPQEAQVRMSVVDVMGREVAKLVDASTPAGRHWATWDGATAHGHAAAGLYFIRMEADGKRMSERVVLIR
jgi:hypothetical protein